MPASLVRQASLSRPRSTRKPLSEVGPPARTSGLFVVGVGASAGGLEACRKLVEALPPTTATAWIYVQHLDPAHESLLVSLLTGHTRMTVLQAADGMLIEPEHLYIIAPGTYLSVSDGALRSSLPQARHGARLPFDFLLRSLAKECGARAGCVVLSGTGADGSLGLKAIKEQGGIIVAQDPHEAAFDGMPLSAIATGAVDLVLPLAKIPEALMEYRRRIRIPDAALEESNKSIGPAWLGEVVELLRTRTDHDFTLYKRGTLERRIERRRAMAVIETSNMADYIGVLANDPVELELLAKDILINVTQFFRDPKVFDLLAKTVVPELVRSHAPGQDIRIWIAGCSTGEETYSLAMLFLEEIAASGRGIKLQVFASDVDPDALIKAREGLYPETIEADVSPTRLANFFLKEGNTYRVLAELRSMVVFTAHDVLVDPPFPRLDMVSCRNLLIYLNPEAQTKAVSFFHFALRDGGILLLGSAETVGKPDGRFEIISKPERIYRHTGHSRSHDVGFSMNSTNAGHIASRQEQRHAISRQSTMAELCRRLVIQSHAPATVLINRDHECIHSVGPTDRYLHVASGPPTQDILAMTSLDVRSRLRLAIQRARQANARVVVTGGTTEQNGKVVGFKLDVEPVSNDGEEMFLVCFVDEPHHDHPDRKAVTTMLEDVPRVAELRSELEATKAELASAIRSLEKISVDHKVVNEEALSVNEEYQSTNEELLTSKEELQALNEELTALNSQLQETLERQRTTSNDLQNVLYSTEVATLFLDMQLNIRFFTPATRSLFNVLPSDIGRPLGDLKSLASDDDILADTQTVLRTSVPSEREIQTQTGIWFVRRILPYRTGDNRVEGVVITFADITERKLVKNSLREAKQLADRANSAKSRFLAAASHDLRQPLQALVLLQGSLANVVQGEVAKKMVERLEHILSSMSGMLNALLDINQIEAGTVHAELDSFPIGELLDQVKDEFNDSALPSNLRFRVAPCSLSIRSDPHLLMQVIRNLLSNAFKYTKRGRVLLGCRRKGDRLRIEIWDTGIGIPSDELKAIFDEYHQLDNAARERSRGLGLGLSIANRLADLLGDRITVRSQPGKGSVFSIEVLLVQPETSAPPKQDGDRVVGVATPEPNAHNGSILVIEDDPEVRDLIGSMLTAEGYNARTASDGVEGLELVLQHVIQPNLILADYNLPGGMNGLQVVASVRKIVRREVPAIILTGDISLETLRDIAQGRCLHLNKPVKVGDLIKAIEGLMDASRHAGPQRALAPAARPGGQTSTIVYIVDDDQYVRTEIRQVLEDDDRTVEDYESCEAFLEAYKPGREACLLVDAYLPGMKGVDLLKLLHDRGDRLPAIMITGNSDVRVAVQAMKEGASDFIEKPIGTTELLESVGRAFEQSLNSQKLFAWREAAASHISGLTPRQHQIMDLVLAGCPSKIIAADLGISQRTVENHRALIMKKTGSRSLPALTRLALAAQLAHANSVDDSPSRD
ncbi:chemotaxis protein CheB [Caballeronia sordidicola]|uniref:histidine kinase n=1 Tax=Caballeronia sordidicola TaxID=196367 RepID=A0A242MI79_CABSO|nr:chemotaxis protein CheB [Caballeronia sordidicola]OTP70929.1 Chemotaxis protein methyltransferase CheR [Caballeronia sordidicola]